LQIRLPDVELKSTGGVPVKDFTRLPKIIGHRTERLAAAGAFPLYPFIYFPFADPRERNAQVDRWAARSEARLEAEAVARRAGEGRLSK
jgi:hypothetical protein